MGLRLGRVQPVRQPIPGPAPWATVGWVMGRPLRGFFQPTGLGQRQKYPNPAQARPFRTIALALLRSPIAIEKKASILRQKQLLSIDRKSLTESKARLNYHRLICLFLAR